MTEEAKPVAWRYEFVSLAYGGGWQGKVSLYEPKAGKELRNIVPLYSGIDYLSALSEAAALREEIERLREATKWFVARASDFDGIPPSKYFGDTDFEMRYPDSKEITVTLGQLRALRAAFGRQS